MSVEDGGPAFPKTGAFHEDQPSYYDSVDQPGMSLRDYFAAKALVGLCANSEFSLFDHGGAELLAGLAANNAYELADAMLRRRIE